MLFEPYAGYLQFVPRLASMAAVHIPAIGVPRLYALVAYIIAIWACSLFIDSRFRGIVESPALRFMVCCAIAVVPPANELIGSLTNAHWYLTLATFLLLIGEPLVGPSFAVQNMWSAAAVLLASLSAAEPLLFVPLAVWRVVTVRDAYARVVPSALLVGSVAQIVTLAIDPTRQGPSAHVTLVTTIRATADAGVHRVLLTAIGGQASSRFISAHGRDGLAVAALVAAAFVTAFVITRFPRIRIRLILLIALGLVLIAAAIDGRGLAVDYPGFRVTNYGGERYFMFPIFTLVLCVAMVLGEISALGARTKCVCFGLIFAAGFLLDFRQPDLPDAHWPSYTGSIDRWIVARRAGLPVQAITIPINPPGWHFRLPARS